MDVLLHNWIERLWV